MKSRRLRARLLVLLSLGLAGAATPSDASRAEDTSRPGIVLEEVGRGSALEGAGLRSGDLLFAWERSPDPPANPEGGKGEIRTVFDWMWVRTEQAPRGALRLQGERNGAAISFEVPKGIWDARARPWMTADLLQTYTEGRRRVEAGDLEGGIALWDRLLQAGEPGLRCWLRLQAGDAWERARQGERARAALQAALTEAGDPQTRIAVWEALGEKNRYANEMARAEASFRSALEVAETTWGESLQVARLLSRVGNILRLQSRLDAAAQLLGRSLEIRQRWAPDSLEVIDSLHHLALVASDQRDLGAMSEQIQRALAIQERWPPDSLAMADILNDVGLLAFKRDRYDEAVAAHQRALTILEQRSPESLELAATLARLGWVYRVLGDLEPAAELLQRALAIREKLAPESLGTGAVLSNLGAIARERGDLAAAQKLFERSLEIWRKAVPRGAVTAAALNSLGIVARLRGNLDESWNLHSRALDMLEQFPDSDVTSNTLDLLGRTAEARGDLNLALDLLQKADAINERIAPSSINRVVTLYQLGRLSRRARRLDPAVQYLARAVDLLESQVGRLESSQEVQSTLRARYDDVYHEAIEVELERGHAARAFHLMERSRARSFLILLAERDLTFSDELPAALESSRRDNAARYDQTLRKLARWTPAAGEGEKEALGRELDRLRQERDEIAAAVRKASPRLAALREPQPLDLDAALRALDLGTLALSYSVGKDQTSLFALTREGGLRVEILKIGGERLRQDVERFLESVRQPASEESPVELARSLYSTLLGPVSDLVELSQRVLIIPDGPLHRLPFGALMPDTAGHRQYLAERKPLHTALSLTVYGALRASRGEPQPARLVAFGDPRYPKGTAASGETRDLILRSPGLRSFDWKPLPYSRREVESIAAAYPEARLYLGEEATEEQAKSVERNVRILHFASHGYIDDKTPLDSALVLTIPEGLPADRDNGLLQVWEIFESVRLDADLVVLSACESALGREVSGEGMIGLTRAFQYAGARSVVASLWNVTDQVTAELMVRFHRHLAAGLSKDEALRQAQIELIREPIRITTANGQVLETDASAPFFWAAFQLFGDWR